ncbi:MAG: 2-C-methyl-D-erythritol 4-phosphate cytidylyltransferase [Thermoleophilia bacterium]
MPVAAILVAAGAGVRMGAPVPKALMPLAGRPMAAWSAEALVAGGVVDALVVVAPPGMEGDLEAALGPLPVPVAVVPGGASRAASVREGLAALPPGTATVLVHDAARPLVSAETVAAVAAAAGGGDGAIAAAPVADTLKQEGADGAIDGTVPRAGLWGAQTPQGFPVAVLRAAVEAAAAAGALDAATDCASLVEAAGGRVRLVETRGPNLKVTTPADRDLAEAILAGRSRG